MKHEIYFIADYLGGLLKIISLGLLLSFVPIYFIDNANVAYLIIIVFILISYMLQNKKWIKNVSFNNLKASIKIDYPLNIYGIKTEEVPFSKISKVTYFGYMFRTPSHCKVVLEKRILRFNCTKEEAKELSELIESENIDFLFDDEKVVGYR